MADIARLAGVSASTVSRALAGSPLVAKAKREEILKLARDRGYVVNSTARNLRLQRTQQVSVVIPLGHEAGQPLTDPFFVQMLGHLADEKIEPSSLSRMWLHQANKGMNDLIGAKVLGRAPTRAEQPNVLQDYANTSSAGSVIAFSQFSDDLPPGSLGVICSFGAGYSAGSVIVRKM